VISLVYSFVDENVLVATNSYQSVKI